MYAENFRVRVLSWFCDSVFYHFRSRALNWSTLIVVNKACAVLIFSFLTIKTLPSNKRWSYLQGFGFNYEYYHWIGGSGETSGDETTYPYIKLGNCIIGSKSALAVNDEKKIKDIVKLFPVPAKDNIHIRFPNHHRYTIELFDMTGKKIKMQQAATEETTIDVSKLSSGSYIVRISSDDKVDVQKVIVEH